MLPLYGIPIFKRTLSNWRRYKSLCFDHSQLNAVVVQGHCQLTSCNFSYIWGVGSTNSSLNHVYYLITFHCQNKFESFRDLLEESGYHLTDRRNMSDLVPFIRKPFLKLNLLLLWTGVHHLLRSYTGRRWCTRGSQHGGRQLLLLHGKLAAAVEAFHPSSVLLHYELSMH